MISASSSTITEGSIALVLGDVTAQRMAVACFGYVACWPVSRKQIHVVEKEISDEDVDALFNSDCIVGVVAI